MKFTKTLISLMIIFHLSDMLYAQHSLNKQAINLNYANSALQQSKLRTLASNKEKLDSLIVQLPDLNGVLQNYSKSLFEYDNVGNLISSIDQYWDSDESVWVRDERRVTVFDLNDLPISIVLYDWDESTLDWALSCRELKSYNANGLLIESIFSDWDINSNIWVNDYRILYSYNANDLLISISDFVFNSDSEAWDPFSIWEYEYKNEIVSSRTLSVYSGTQTALQQKVEYTYDENDKVTEANVYTWSEEWLMESQTIYSYNSQGQLIEEVVYTNSGTLAPDTRFVYSYPFTVDMDMLVLPDLLYDFNNTPDQEILANSSKFIYNTTNQLWELVSKTMVYFSEFDESITSTAEIKNTDFQFAVYPNPASEYIMITSDFTNEQQFSIDILDAMGNLILLSKVVDNQQRIDIGNFQSGIYFTRLHLNGHSKTLKLIIQ